MDLCVSTDRAAAAKVFVTAALTGTTLTTSVIAAPRLPALQTGRGLVFGTNAICRYLCLQSLQIDKLFASDLRVDQWLEWDEHQLGPLLMAGGATAAGALDILERALGNTARLVGSEHTLADFVLGCSVKCAALAGTLPAQLGKATDAWLAAMPSQAFTSGFASADAAIASAPTSSSNSRPLMEGEPTQKKSKSQLKKEAKAAAKAAAKSKGGKGGGKGGKGRKSGPVEEDGPSTCPGPYTGPQTVSVGNVDTEVGQGIAKIVRDRFGVEVPANEVLQTNAVEVRASRGDMSCTAGFKLKKELKGANVSAELSEEIAKRFGGLFEAPTVAGNGFISLRYTREFINEQLQRILADTDRVYVSKKQLSGKTVVDFSSPNVAKEMHVGHLRSTIIGDSIKRHLAFLGHEVLGLNHVGDWGTQFGMLITYMRNVVPEALTQSGQVDLGDLVVLYKKSKKAFDEGLSAPPSKVGSMTADEFKNTSRAEVVKLQGGDPESTKCWKMLLDQSEAAFNQIYEILDIRNLVLRGESFYNPMLQETVDSLMEKGLTVKEDGAVMVQLEGFWQKQSSEDAKAGKPKVPSKMIVQKKEGGFLYATTDLAAIRHRTENEAAKRVIYCTDSGQSDHFQQVFQIAGKAGWGESASLEHVPFGLVCGEDGGKLKTRSGETTPLRELLETAVIFAHAVMLEKYKAELEKCDGVDTQRKEWLQSRLGPYQDKGRLEKIVASLVAIKKLDEGEKMWFEKRDELRALLKEGACDPWLESKAAPAVGIGSVKFADLSMTRTNNYRFSYKKMVSFAGKSAPFMLYQFVRIKSIVRKFGGDSVEETGSGALKLNHAAPVPFLLVKPAEKDLARHCLDFSRVLLEVEASLYPHRTCDYMYDCSQLFSKFYSSCRVGNAETQELKLSRLALCVVVVNTLKVGFDLIGLKTLEVM